MKIILILILMPCLVLAQPQQSADFRITKSVIDAGGATSSSADFRLTGAFGQPSPLGWQSSANFGLSGGFLSPLLSVSPLSPIQDLVINYNVPDATLHWGRISSAHSYRIYRATDPLFTPGPTNLLGVAADTLYIDPNILSLADSRYYYIIIASSAPPTMLAKSGLLPLPHIAPQTILPTRRANKPDIETSVPPKPPQRKSTE